MSVDHGLTVEQLSDTELVRRMCEIRPGLPPASALQALLALRTLHMAVHRDGEPCGERPAPLVCEAQSSGPFGKALTCFLAPHEGPWHDNGRGTLWRCMDGGGWQLKQGPTPRHD